METIGDKRHRSYLKYLETQCCAWTDGEDQSLETEILNKWEHREMVRRNMSDEQRELDRVDSNLMGLLFELKKIISKLGRNGGWSTWLQTHKIPRSTADRLVLEHAEYFDLTDELPHRTPSEPLEGNICTAAFRTVSRHERLLRSAKSKMVFMRSLGDVLGLSVEYEDDRILRMAEPAIPVEDSPESFDFNGI